MTHTFTLKTLPEESIEQGATVAAECGAFVVVHLEPMRYVDAEPSCCVVVVYLCVCVCVCVYVCTQREQH